MWKLLQRFSALERKAQAGFLGGAALLPLIAVSLRIAGFRTTQAMLQKFLSTGAETIRHRSQNLALDASRTAHMRLAAARYSLVHYTCLEKSLALWWLLGRQGIASSVRIGTRKSARGLEAHAWVEFDGTALNEIDAAHERYDPFDAAFPLPSQE
jgi:hypothetical protein